MRAVRPHIFEQTPETLRLAVEGLKMPAYRADQILQWVYERHIVDPALMTNLSKWERERIAEAFAFLSGQVVRDQRATDKTRKLLVRWQDEVERAPASGSGAVSSVNLPLLAGAGGSERETECVMIPSEGRNTACISSQVGCPVGCRFCASGIGGLDGNLSAGRIVEQVWLLDREVAREQESRISNVVFMGMGEPLANYSATVKAVRLMMGLWGLGIGGRKITISTVGLPAAIRRLADEELSVTLAISLHAPNDRIRRDLIPWAEFTTIEELMSAGQYYFERTGREVTLEYILLGGVNDQPEHARELVEVARTLRANVNLIRYNEVAGMPFSRPSTDDVRTFQEILRRAHVNSHIRASRGRDIAAACGQLRHEHRTAPA